MDWNNIPEIVLLDYQQIKVTVLDILFIILLIIITSIFLKLIKKLIRSRVVKSKLDRTKIYSIFSFFKYIIWIITAILILNTVGVKLTWLFAGSAALLVGIGLGLQKIFKDSLSGVLLLFEGSIKIKEVVEVDGIVGVVEKIGLRTSRIKTRDNIVMIIPNSRFIENIVINWSDTEQKTRFFVEVGVAYSSDVDKVRHILYDIVTAHKSILQYPKPFIRLHDFGDSALIFRIYFWTEQNFYIENIKSEMRFHIVEVFREKGVEIPFPQRDVHYKK
ncbi:MAG: mechanosensitive ion channel [Bacteroidales bacterium]|jgi:small-conductance mechanosensitive channel|nr:mechanosensitive ion channel [Bacteroidales bacterium]